MADLLPGGAVETADEDPRVLGLDEEEADAVLGALSSDTARDILASVHEEYGTPSELADAADTSLQNAQYHIEKLADADLIEPRGTRYSSKGREMTVYGPADSPLVLFAGDESESEGLKGALAAFLGSAAVLAAVSVLVQVALRGLPGGDSGGGETVETATVAEESAAASSAATAVPPGLLVFLGGLVVLLVAAGVWYARW